MSASRPSAPIEMESSQSPVPLELTGNQFRRIAELARREFGLELGEGKQHLVASRLGKLMRQQGIFSFRDYYQRIEQDATGGALVELIDALTTNHTSFFREQAHFDFLVEQVFPDWKRSGPERIWSAASATGEEPYTIALLAREYFGAESSSLPQIVASDISTRALAAARKGIYREERFQGVLTPWLKKHLLHGEGHWRGWYRMRPEILAMVQFHRINLIEPLPEMGSFAVIFCRNVMIYFSRETQELLVNRLAACLQPGGYLFVGHSESLSGIRHPLQHLQPAIYRKRGGRR